MMRTSGFYLSYLVILSFILSFLTFIFLLLYLSLNLREFGHRELQIFSSAFVDGYLVRLVSEWTAT